MADIRQRRAAGTSEPTDAVATSKPKSRKQPGSSSNGTAKDNQSVGCWNICKLLVVLGFITAALPVIFYTVSIKSGHRYAVNTTHNTTNWPATYHSRYRREEYLPRGDFFFQWWNYLVYDSQTDDHFNIIYQVTDYAPASSRSDVASVSVVHMRGSRTLATASMDIPLAQLEVVGDLGLVYRAADGSIPFRQEVIDDATYRLYAEFPADKVSTGQPLGWELTFHRIHGMYGGQDQEEGNKAELCFIVSTLFAHNSRVQGVFRSAEQEFRFEDKPRFRAYAAGSWGCQLPNGRPAVDYPWTWFWLSIPGDQTPSGEDIGIVMGTARFQSGVPLLNDIYGGFSTVGVGSRMWTSRFATVNHGGSVELPLLGSASDRRLENFTVTHGEWSEFKDSFGSARIPLQQRFEILTEELEARVEFFSELPQYFRAPVRLEKALELRVFSDFRAVGVRTRVYLRERASGQVLFDGEVRTQNALEYAYEPEVDMAEMQKWGLLG